LEEFRRLCKEEGLSRKQAAHRLGLGGYRYDEHGKPLEKWNKKTGGASGANVSGGVYVPPEKVNPGNVIRCGAVGGGHLGSNISHENEAPFPDKVPNFFIRSFCPVGGVVLDPFGGSGTTLAEAVKTDRKFVSIDLRESQCKLMDRRVLQARVQRGFGLLT
jgi:hypothetical protein